MRGLASDVAKQLLGRPPEVGRDYEESFDGVFDVDYIIPLPERLDHRLAALAAVGDPLAPETGAMAID